MIDLIPGSSIISLNVFQDKILEEIEESDNKVKIDFSFNPFYVIGLKYEIKEEKSTTLYRYDLNGRLREISHESSSGDKISYKISYKNVKIDLPDLSEYN